MKLKFWKKAPSGSYVGRLAFDSPSGFHYDMVPGIANVPVKRKNGKWCNKRQRILVTQNRVVTDDEGKTWRYFEEGDQSHQERYHERVVALVGTTDTDPHHFFPTPDDPHYCAGATDLETGQTTNTRLINSQDDVAPLETSHTEAYRV